MSHFGNFYCLPLSFFLCFCSSANETSFRYLFMYCVLWHSYSLHIHAFMCSLILCYVRALRYSMHVTHGYFRKCYFLCSTYPSAKQEMCRLFFFLLLLFDIIFFYSSFSKIVECCISTCRNVYSFMCHAIVQYTVELCLSLTKSKHTHTRTHRYSMHTEFQKKRHFLACKQFSIKSSM